MENVIKDSEEKYMSNILIEIQQRMEQLKQVINEKSEAISKAPKGVLNLAKTESRVRYYYKENPSQTERTYLKKENQHMIELLCQKDYDQKVLHTAQKELYLLEQLKEKYPMEICEDIYAGLHVDRKKYVQPIIVPDEDFIKAWREMEYRGKGFREDAPEYYTDKGERVRSKSEILIANALNRNHIPYRYECPLYLAGYGTIHPDFTVLNVRLRKEMYWEHLGMMDEPEYIEDALNRISLYEKNHYFPGDRLILTHETLRHPLNSKNIENMIFQYLQ